jgi:hypothetical protein
MPQGATPSPGTSSPEGSDDRRRGTDPDRPIGRIRNLGPIGRGTGAFGIYAVCAIAIWGREVLFDLTHRCVGVCAADARFYVWCLRWIPHAIAEGEHPLHPDVIWAPHGIDLSFVASIPGPATVMAPISGTFGPLFAYNILLLASPILAAWAGYLVCATVTARFVPSLVGGAVFGFSSYVTHFMYAQVNLTLIFPAALLVYLVLRRVNGTLGVRAFVLLMTLVLGALASISTELLATTTFFGAIALGLAILFGGERRREIVRAAGWIGLAYSVVGLVLLPYVDNVLRHAPDEPIRVLELHSADLTSFIRPPHDVLLAPMADHVGHPGAAYLGPVFLLLLVAFAWEGRASRSTWLLVGFVVVAAAFSLGPTILVDGSRTIPGPGSLVARIPLLQHAVPNRFPAFMWLTLAVLAALWVATASGRAPIVRSAVVVGLVFLLPALSPPFHGTIHVPSFFEENTYLDQIRPGEIVLAQPWRLGDDLTWQVAAGLDFRLAQGYVGAYPARADLLRLSGAIRERVPSVARITEVVARRDVAVIVIEEPVPALWAERLDAITGSTGVSVGGVRVYRVAAGDGSG